MKRPTIEECFFRTEEGKCVSPEIYRFNPHVEKTGNCAFHPKAPAFINGKLICLEFRPKDDSEEWELNLKAAMIIVRDLRASSIRQGLDPRAMRVAIYCLKFIDDHFAKDKLSQEDDAKLKQFAWKLFQEQLKKEVRQEKTTTQ